MAEPDWKLTRMPAMACPLCGRRLDAASPGLGEDPAVTPAEGDLTVCIGCVGVLVFDRDLRLRSATAPELMEAMTMPHVVLTIRAINAAKQAGMP